MTQPDEESASLMREAAQFISGLTLSKIGIDLARRLQERAAVLRRPAQPTTAAEANNMGSAQ